MGAAADTADYRRGGLLVPASIIQRAAAFDDGASQTPDAVALGAA